MPPHRRYLKLYVLSVRGNWSYAAGIIDRHDMAEFVVHFTTFGDYTDVLLRAPQTILNAFDIEYRKASLNDPI